MKFNEETTNITNNHPLAFLNINSQIRVRELGQESEDPKCVLFPCSAGDGTQGLLVHDKELYH